MPGTVLPLFPGNDQYAGPYSQDFCRVWGVRDFQKWTFFTKIIKKVDLLHGKWTLPRQKWTFWIIFEGFTEENGPFSSTFSCLGAQFSVFLPKSGPFVGWGAPSPPGYGPASTDWDTQWFSSCPKWRLIHIKIGSVMVLHLK